MSSVMCPDMENVRNFTHARLFVYINIEIAAKQRNLSVNTIYIVLYYNLLGNHTQAG